MGLSAVERNSLDNANHYRERITLAWTWVATTQEPLSCIRYFAVYIHCFLYTRSFFLR